MNQHTEKTVLGACLKEIEAARKAVQYLQPEHFELDSHQRIFRRIVAAIQTEKPLDAVLLMQDLSRGGELSAVGGAEYVMDLETGVPYNMAGKIQQYAELIKESWRMRELQVVSDLIAADTTAKRLSSAELCRRIGERIEWINQTQETDPTQPFFVDYPDFVTKEYEQIDWMVAGIIERGANGFIAAEPKGSKSFCSCDLAIALATGASWLEFAVPRPVRVGMVTREDNPSLTRWRLRNLAAGRAMNVIESQRLEENLWVNTRAQTPTLMLDNERELGNLIATVKDRQIEFVILDVLNVLHGSDENDNTQMAAVLRKVRRIQEKTGASIGIIHHYNKNDNAGKITQRLRGASAIAGFAEWIIGLSLVDEENKIRRMEFELKAGSSPDPVHFKIDQGEGFLKLKRVIQQSAPKKGTK